MMPNFAFENMNLNISVKVYLRCDYHLSVSFLLLKEVISVSQPKKKKKELFCLISLEVLFMVHCFCY